MYNALHDDIHGRVLTAVTINTMMAMIAAFYIFG